MKSSEKLLLAAAVLLILFGLVMILGTTINIFDRNSKDSVPGDLAGLILAGVIPVVLGGWLFRHTLQGASRRAFEAREVTILRLAGQHKGMLTAPQVAADSDMSVEQAKEVLDRLYRKSFNQVALSESGEMVYQFQLEQTSP